MRNYWLTLALCTAACGGSDGDGIAIDDFPTEIAAAQCANLVECGDMPDLDTCLGSIVFEGNDVETLIASVKDGTIDYDEGAAGACADQIAGQGCAFEGFYQVNACADIFAGTLQAGETCFDDAECAGTAACNFADPNCDITIACCTGSCDQSLTQSAIGGPCNDDLNFCDPESAFCKVPEAGGVGVCTTPDLGEGEACADLDACANPAYCDLLAASPTCTVPPGPGQACDLNEILPCADFSTYCDTVTLTCEDVVGPGSACDAADPGGAACTGFAPCTNGSCVADPGPGDTCDPAGALCLGNLDCVGTTCTPPSPGVACP